MKYLYDTFFEKILIWLVLGICLAGFIKFTDLMLQDSCGNIEYNIRYEMKYGPVPWLGPIHAKDIWF